MAPRLEDRCVLRGEIHFVFTLAVPSDCDIMVAVSLLLLDCQSPGPPGFDEWLRGSENSETGAKATGPHWKEPFFLKVVKIYLCMKKRWFLQTVFEEESGQTQLAAV